MKIYILFFITLLNLNLIFAQTNTLYLVKGLPVKEDEIRIEGQLTTVDKEVIKSEVRNLILDFETYCDAVGDISESREDREQFFSDALENLFTSDKILVINDIDPAQKTGEALPVGRYVKNILLWYPNGLKTEIRNKEALEFGEITKLSKNKYYVDVKIKKYISGFYMNSEMNRKESNLTLRIGFVKNGLTFDGFKIAGIKK